MGAIGPGDNQAHPLGAGAGAQLGAIRTECLNRPGSQRSMSQPHGHQPHSRLSVPGRPRTSPGFGLSLPSPSSPHPAPCIHPFPSQAKESGLCGPGWTLCLLSLFGPRNSRAVNSARSSKRGDLVPVVAGSHQDCALVLSSVLCE